MEIKLSKRRTEVLGEGGIPFCEVSVTLPSPIDEGEGAARVTRFYEAIAAGVVALGKNVLLPLAKGAYEKNDDPRRRFTHRPYHLLHTVRSEKKDTGEVSILRTLELSHRGRVLLRRQWQESILEGGKILPRRENKGKQRRPTPPEVARP